MLTQYDVLVTLPAVLCCIYCVLICSHVVSCMCSGVCSHVCVQLERQHDDETLALFLGIVEQSRSLRRLQARLVALAEEEAAEARAEQEHTGG